MIKKFTAPWVDSWNFFKNPKDQKDLNQHISNKLRQLFSIFILDIFIVSAVAMLIVAVEEAGFVSTETHMMNELMETLSPVLILFMGVILAPLFEELIFRLYLRKRYNPIRLISFFAGVIRPSSKEKMETTLDQFWQKYYKIFFYTATLIFAIIHITNYEMTFTVLLFIPLLTAPQFIAGLFMGYLRVRFGLLWGMLLHVLHNFIFLGIGLMFMTTSFDTVYKENESYKFNVEEQAYGDANSYMDSFTGDTISYKNVKFKTLMAQVLDSDEKFIKIDPERFSSKRFSFNLIVLTDKLEPRQIILSELGKAFNFKVSRENIIQESWVMTIENKDQLYSNLSDIKGNSISSVNSKMIKLKKQGLQQLTKTLNLNYDEFIFTELEITDKFDFEFDKTDFEYIKQQLLNTYGLELVKASREIERVTIVFSE